MSKRRWVAGLGAGSLLLAGGIAADLRGGAARQGTTPDEIGEDEAAAIALEANPETEVVGVESEREGGRRLYEVELANGVEVEIDAVSGEIVVTEREDDGGDGAGDADEGEDTDEDEAGGVVGTLRAGSARFARLAGGGGDEAAVAPGTLDDDEEPLPQAEITLEEAVEAAQGAASGAIGEIDLERVDGRLVFNVDVGDEDVKVDAGTGEVVAVAADDAGASGLARRGPGPAPGTQTGGSRDGAA